MITISSFSLHLTFLSRVVFIQCHLIASCNTILYWLGFCALCCLSCACDEAHSSPSRALRALDADEEARVLRTISRRACGSEPNSAERTVIAYRTGFEARLRNDARELVRGDFGEVVRLVEHAQLTVFDLLETLIGDGLLFAEITQERYKRIEGVSELPSQGEHLFDHNACVALADGVGGEAHKLACEIGESEKVSMCRNVHGKTVLRRRCSYWAGRRG